MNVLFSQNNPKIANINNSQSKEKSKNYLSVFSNIESSKNRYLSENQRNLTQFNSKKIIKRESQSKNKSNIKTKNKAFLVSSNDNNILKLYSNLYTKSSKIVKNGKNNSKNKSYYLSKPQIEIEINNINNINNSKNLNKNPKIKKYKKNISEHDLVSKILTSFNNSNFPKSTNNKINNKKNMAKTRHASDTKLLRSSSVYSYINNMAKTNSFFNGNHSNNLGYISTWGNSPEMTNINYKSPNKKNNGSNKKKNKTNKEPVIGKIIKNYKNNDLNCIFNMNLIPPISPINNIQDYFKNLYKIEYNSDYRVQKNKNNSNIKKYNHNIKRSHKESDMDRDKDGEKEIKTKSNNDDYSQSKNTMTKTNESKFRKEKDSIENHKYCNDSPEEIHFYVITSIQNGKNMICHLNKK